jgi:hypothetical protein
MKWLVIVDYAGVLDFKLYGEENCKVEHGGTDS